MKIFKINWYGNPIDIFLKKPKNEVKVIAVLTKISNKSLL